MNDTMVDIIYSNMIKIIKVNIIYYNKTTLEILF